MKSQANTYKLDALDHFINYFLFRAPQCANKYSATLENQIPHLIYFRYIVYLSEIKMLF